MIAALAKGFRLWRGEYLKAAERAADLISKGFTVQTSDYSIVIEKEQLAFPELSMIMLS